jgi:GTPase KRas protein
MSRTYNSSTVTSIPNNNAVLAHPNSEGINTNNMDRWRVAVLGDGGVGKTALAVQVSLLALSSLPISLMFCPSSP